MIGLHEIGVDTESTRDVTRPADLSSPNAAGLDQFTQAENLCGDEPSNRNSVTAANAFLPVDHENNHSPEAQ